MMIKMLLFMAMLAVPVVIVIRLSLQNRTISSHKLQKYLWVGAIVGLVASLMPTEGPLTFLTMWIIAPLIFIMKAINPFLQSIGLEFLNKAFFGRPFLFAGLYAMFFAVIACLGKEKSAQILIWIYLTVAVCFIISIVGLGLSMSGGR